MYHPALPTKTSGTRPGKACGGLRRANFHGDVPGSDWGQMAVPGERGRSRPWIPGVFLFRQHSHSDDELMTTKHEGRKTDDNLLGSINNPGGETRMDS
jgi:hypothetical protein